MVEPGARYIYFFCFFVLALRAASSFWIFVGSACKALALAARFLAAACFFFAALEMGTVARRTWGPRRGQRSPK